jgi:hypothetical protein
MLLAQDFRRQALVCARLADDCDDPRASFSQREQIVIGQRGCRYRKNGVVISDYDQTSEINPTF